MARVKRRLTYDMIVYHFNYCPETGDFVWRNPRVSWTPVGSRAGWVDPQGYRKVRIYGHTYSVGRLAWMLMTGFWPDGEIDHINRVPWDNRWANLRQATREQNVRNSAKRNKLGVPGVSRVDGGYVARVTIDGIRRYLGFYTRLDAAAEAVKEARTSAHREFACLEAK